MEDNKRILTKDSLAKLQAELDDLVVNKRKEIAAKIKEAVSIPVIGSGDIYTREDALRMQKETGVDGVMVARGVRGNPWIFRSILNENFKGPSIQEVKDMVMKQMALMLETFPEEPAVRQMRKHVAFYVTGFHNASQLKRDINYCNTLDEFRETLTLWNA